MSQDQQTPDELRIHVVANLRLTPKSNLHLVEVGDQRVLVASDLTRDQVGGFFDQFICGGTRLVGGHQSLASNDDQRRQRVRNGNLRKSANNRSQANAEIEAEMQRKLSEVLGGQAFKDVFLQVNPGSRLTSNQRLARRPPWISI